MPQEYNKLGISFQYPDNWSLDEENALEGGQSVTVYSPGGGFWSVSVNPPSDDPAGLAEAAVEVMREEYDEVEAESVRQTMGEHDLVGYDLNFYCLDLTNTARVRSVRTDTATLTVFFQAEDLDFDQIEPVFQAMTVSLMSNVTTFS